MSLIKKILILACISLLLASCGGFQKVDTRKVPIKGTDRARKNVEEGRGFKLGDIGKNRSTNYEFSTSNPMWRASLETLDFLPLSTVDYSGGVIITDWYSENNADESIKITLRFLSNEIRSDSLKIILHKKSCDKNMNCKTNIINTSTIKDELRSTILRKASLLEKTDKQKK